GLSEPSRLHRCGQVNPQPCSKPRKNRRELPLSQALTIGTKLPNGPICLASCSASGHQLQNRSRTRDHSDSSLLRSCEHVAVEYLDTKYRGFGRIGLDVCLVHDSPIAPR